MGKEKLSSAYSVCLKVLCVIVSPILEDFQGQTSIIVGWNIINSAKYLEKFASGLFQKKIF